ncbi:response regulator [Rhodanobacter sp. KK11]|uniref:response regulator n=1 Tax=Rhodanobacter sp. KK11 TaxID=3083255 RepID=UPI002967376C|nr:response regulator [Rhodanobacter sp. KK11]MDW2982657.1 response regulator [Rhodanobacter sp. KK11]
MPTTRSPNTWLADRPLQHKIVLAIGLLLGLFLLASAISLHSLRQQESDRDGSMHTYQVLLQLDHVLQTVQASQVAARGYLLTQDAAQRDAFESANRELHTHLTRLRELMSDSPLQLSRIDKVEEMAALWQREFRSEVIGALAGPGTTDPAQAALQRLHIQSDYLKHRSISVKEINGVINRMTLDENRLLTMRNQRLDRTIAVTRVVNVAAALLAILLGLAIIRLTLRLVTHPLRGLTDQLTRLANHDHDFEIRRLDRRDEIGEIARALQVFKRMSMETEAQSWIKEQVSGISHLLLQATTHKEFAQWLTSALAPLCKAGVCLFYSYDDARHRLDLIGSYGLRLNNRSADQYLPGEGLVGQCALERKPIILDDVPAHYLHIDSGSGEALPGHLAILPVLYRDTLIGVLELASFTPPPPLTRQLLDELLPLVALSLENLNRTISVEDLLLRTQEQADELRVSELVMRQQKEVLRDNNDALQAKTEELEEQSRRLIASEEELRIQAGELQASNEELREMTESLNRQKYVLEDLQQETADKAAELARANQYKSEFLANMSHELRTPLNSLLILSRDLADNAGGNLDAEQVESARVIHDAGNSLLRLINDILDLSKIEAGKMELVIDELPLAELGRRLRRTFAHVAAQKSLGFALEIEPDLPATLRTDGARLEQIANNLLGNAFKFTAEGAVNLHIGRPDGETEVPGPLRGQPLLALTVSDTGIGIPADKLERIFNAFEQVDAGTSRQFGGTGLGLAISRRMARMLGGDLVARSELGRGSRFTVLLPQTPPAIAPADLAQPGAVPDRQAALPRTTTSHPVAAGGELAGRRVLLVDDDMRNLFALSRVLRGWGMQVSLAQDGAKALRMLADEAVPELLLIDIMMPGMDGYELIRTIRAQPRYGALPIIALTAKAMHGDREKCLAMGASDYLSKPIDLDRLATTLLAWLRH